MPRGRPRNHDARIAALLKQLRAELFAREQARIAATVDAQMAGLVAGLGKAGAAVVAAPAAAAPAAPAAPDAKKRKGWSPAAKAKARLRMQKYWAARKGKAGKRGKGAKAVPAATA
jgi:hypothetical protein